MDDVEAMIATISVRSGTESPIEELMLEAIFAQVMYGTEADFRRMVLNKDTEDDWVDNPRPDTLYIETQAPVLKYRVDFLIPTPGPAKLVVECDGHNFHERTKEQAAHDRTRDRAMTEVGFTVFRFTGSEIYRDPVKCAKQVVAWAYKNYYA